MTFAFCLLPSAFCRRELNNRETNIVRPIKKEKIKEIIDLWRPLLLPGFVLLMMITVARTLGTIESLELWAFDEFLKLRPTEKVDERIAIVGIDDEDINKIGNYPVPDRDLAILIKRIQEYKPALIGLDLVRDLPVEPGHKQLARVLKENNNIVGIEKVLPPTFAAPPSLPSQRIGFVDVKTDRDSNVRRIILTAYIQEKNAWKYSFDLVLAEKYLSARGIEVTNGIRNPNAFMFGDTELPVFLANFGGYVGEDDRGIQILLNYRSGSNRFEIISYREIMKNQFDPNLLRDRIVLIGMNATSVGKDIFDVAGVNNIYPSPGNIYGVEIRAHSLSQILSAVLDRRPLLKTWPDLFEYVWIWLWGFWGISLAMLFRSPWSNLLAITMSVFLVLGFSSILFNFGWWIPVVPALLILFLNGVVLSIFSQYNRALKDRISVQRATIERTFEDIHNGPLQTLKSLMREVKDRDLPQDLLLDRLETLDRDLRKMYDFLQQQTFTSDNSILLGNGVKIDLDRPLHELLYLVYRNTLERDFPCYKTLKITIPKFPEFQDRNLSPEQKRGLCRFLEESLCNVGKYAEGATRLKVTFDRFEGTYLLRVEDNGIGVSTVTEGQGTKIAKMLARQLRGRFDRHPVSPQGTRCELVWPAKKKLFSNF